MPHVTLLRNFNDKLKTIVIRYIPEKYVIKLQLLVELLMIKILITAKFLNNFNCSCCAWALVHWLGMSSVLLFPSTNKRLIWKNVQNCRRRH